MTETTRPSITIVERRSAVALSFLCFGYQRSDESAFFRQETFSADEERIISSTLFIAVGCQNGCAHRKRTWWFDPCYAWFADCSEGFFVLAQTKARQAERCACLPVPRLLSHEQLSIALRCLHCVMRSAEQQPKISVLVARFRIIRPKLGDLGCDALRLRGTS